MVISPKDCKSQPEVIETTCKRVENHVDKLLQQGYRNISVKALVEEAGQYSYNVRVQTLKRYEAAGWKIEEFSGSQRDPSPLSWIFTEVK